MAHVDHEMRILDAFAQNSPTIRERLAEGLRWDPDAVGRAFRHSYDQRATLHAWNSDAFRPIAVTLKDMLQLDEFIDDADIWEGIVQSDLCDAFTETMFREDFFDEDQELFTAVYEGFAGIVLGASDRSLDDYITLSTRSEILWEYLWRHRDRLTASGDTVLRGIACLIGAFTCASQQRESPIIPTYLPYIGIHMFVYVEDSGENMLQLLDPFLMTYAEDEDEDVDVDEGDASDAFIRAFQEAVMDDLEGNLFFTRLNMVMETQALSFLRGGDGAECERRKIVGLRSCVDTLLLITSVPNIFPLLESWDCLSNVLRLAKTLHGRMPSNLYRPILCFLCECFEAFFHSNPGNAFSNIPGYESLSFLARGIERASASGADILEGRFDEIFCETLEQFISVARNADAHLPCRRMTAEMVVSAREVWWPTLRVLQQANSRSPFEAGQQLLVLMGRWSALGVALNLDVAAERQRHERETRRRCAWRECQFHRQTLPEGVELRTCSGCHDARYCGRTCQKRDWSNGGHKERCRRLM